MYLGVWCCKNLSANAFFVVYGIFTYFLIAGKPLVCVQQCDWCECLLGACAWAFANACAPMLRLKQGFRPTELPLLQRLLAVFHEFSSGSKCDGKLKILPARMTRLEKTHVETS